MRNNNRFNTQIYDAYHSATTKYYNALLILLITAPLVVICFISLNGPLIFTVTMFLSCIPIVAIVVYLAIIGSKLKYELSPNEFKVTFGIFNKKIPYTQITNIEKTQLALGMKIFGAGMPGLYWGLFTTSTTGNVQAYCTKLTGDDYIALTLSNGPKIVISPKNPDQFLNALNQKNPALKTTYQTSKNEIKKTATANKQICLHTNFNGNYSILHFP